SAKKLSRSTSTLRWWSKALNRSCFLSFASLPHTVQPLGHALPALCRVHVRLSDVLPRQCPFLPSLRKGCPPLFGWFTGNTTQSDFSGTYMSAVRLVA